MSWPPGSSVDPPPHAAVETTTSAATAAAASRRTPARGLNDCTDKTLTIRPRTANALNQGAPNDFSDGPPVCYRVISQATSTRTSRAISAQVTRERNTALDPHSVIVADPASTDQ